MRPVRTIAAALLVASIAVAGCSTRDTSPPGDAAPSIAAPATPAPDQPTSDQPTSDQPAPRPPVARPPSTAEAVVTAVSFMRREVGMAHPIAGPFRQTGATTGQVDIHASSSPSADVVAVDGEPVTTVSLQRLRTVWHVTGTRTPAIKVLSPQPRDAVRSPVGVLGVAPAAIDGQVRVRVTRDRYGKDIELGSGSLTADSAGAGGEFSGEIAFRPSGTAGSVVFTVDAGGNGQVAAATVVRVRFATSQPPRIQQVITTPKLSEMHGRLLLPDRVEIQVFATGADRARLVLTPTGTAAAYHSEVVAEATPAEDGLYLVWRPDDGVIGSLTIQVTGPGGSARHDIGDVYHE
jgi:Immunoglobulin-like domain of bacterial spore germination